MADLTDEEFEAANERGRISFETEPHAKSARFDRATRMIVVELYNGCIFAFPPRQLQGLENATDDELAEVEVLGVGYGLHWGTRDADFTVPGLLAGRFGTAAFMKKHRERLRAILADWEAGRRNAAA